MSFENVGGSIAALEAAKEQLDLALSLYQQDAEALKTAPLEVLARAFVALDKAHEAADDARKALNKEILHLQNATVPSRFEKAEVPSMIVTLKSGRKYNVIPGSRLSVSMTDKEKGIDWLKGFDVNSAALVQETVNAQTLSSYARQLAEEKGMELPEEFFKTVTSPYVSIRAKA